MTPPGKLASLCWPSRAFARTTSGGHYVIEEAIRAQFGASLRAFGGLRRRRNELEYPLYPTEKASAEEAAEAIKTADHIIEAVAGLLPNLGFF